MGLDTIAYKEYRNGEHIEADSEWFTGTEVLTRGCLSEDLSWIRGKVYALLVEELSGVSLYTESLDNATVWRITEAIRAYNQNPLAYRDVFYHNFDKEELHTLERWFYAAANNGCYLRGWW